MGIPKSIEKYLEENVSIKNGKFSIGNTSVTPHTVFDLIDFEE